MKRKEKFIATTIVIMFIVVSISVSALGVFNIIKEKMQTITMQENSYIDNLANGFYGNSASYGLKQTTPILNTKEILFNLDNEPEFVLYENHGGGYFIVNRETATVYERSEDGKSPYSDKDGKKYYDGYMNYLHRKGNDLIDIISGEKYSLNEIKNSVKALDTIKKEDVKENGSYGLINKNETSYMKEGEVLNATKESRWGTNDAYASGAKDYFSALKSQYLIDIYSSKSNVSRDLPFPDNEHDSCAIVAAIILLQYYERRDILKTIPDNFVKNVKGITNVKTDFQQHISSDAIDIPLNGKAYNNPKNTLTEMLQLDMDNRHRGKGNGPIVSAGIKKMVKEFYDAYNDGNQTILMNYNATYNNIVASVQNNNLAIGQTAGTGIGYFKDSSGWKKTGVDRHQMVIYGYCTSNGGTLKDFITHSGWYYPGSQKMYVYKSHFVSNLTHNRVII